jgi:murein DD-endopeptidase MepM/ murein hydrolase activator NlpD
MAPRNTPVRSTTDGYVSRRAVLRLGGRTISIIGPAGYRHYYAHLERWANIAEKDRVAAGDVIGYVGNSGNASGGPTHLHYAIYRKDGRALDPYPLLRRGPGSFE